MSGRTILKSMFLYYIWDSVYNTRLALGFTLSVSYFILNYFFSDYFILNYSFIVLLMFICLVS